MDMSRRQFLKVAGLGVLSVASMGALAGCGSGSKGSGSSSDSKIATIKERGKLKCGVKKDVLGYGYLDTKTKKYEGLEIDLCYQIAAAVPSAYAGNFLVSPLTISLSACIIVLSS